MSFDWSDGHDWQAKYFGLPVQRRTPRGYRSQARIDWDEEMARQEQADAAFTQAAVARQRELVEQARVEQWRPLVERFGAATVEALVRRVDPRFELPASLKGASDVPVD